MNTKTLVPLVALPGLYAAALGLWCASVDESDYATKILMPPIAILSLVLMLSMLNVVITINKMQVRIDALEKERAVTASRVTE